MELREKIKEFWRAFNDIRNVVSLVAHGDPVQEHEDAVGDAQEIQQSTNQSHLARCVALDGLLLNSCFNELSYLSTGLSKLSKIDFISELPMEINFKIMNYLDAQSLCRAAQVCLAWAKVANNDVIWRRMCSQHIDKTCSKCGWGLPLMTRYLFMLHCLELLARHSSERSAKLTVCQLQICNNQTVSEADNSPITNLQQPNSHAKSTVED